MRATEHYAEAERLLDYDPEDLRDPIADAEVAQYRVQQAQAHATLALAGATALQSYARVGGDDSELDDWKAAAGGES